MLGVLSRDSRVVDGTEKYGFVRGIGEFLSFGISGQRGRLPSSRGGEGGIDAILPLVSIDHH